ncbi:MAG TPA: hypothetical protein V6C95_10450 [Coleofasciculaceae cyanobacterium]
MFVEALTQAHHSLPITQPITYQHFSILLSIRKLFLRQNRQHQSIQG